MYGNCTRRFSCCDDPLNNEHVDNYNKTQNSRYVCFNVSLVPQSLKGVLDNGHPRWDQPSWTMVSKIAIAINRNFNPSHAAFGHYLDKNGCFSMASYNG